MHHLQRVRAFSVDGQRAFHRALSGRSNAHGYINVQPSSSTLRQSQRHFHRSSPLLLPPAAPKSKDRGPTSKEDTQTDFTAMNVLGNIPPPTTGVDSCMDDGFALNSGLRVTGAGVLLYGGEAFQWRPWSNGSSDSKSLRNAKGQFEVDSLAWGILDLAWPKPDLLVLGTGKTILPLSPATRGHINSLGIRIEVLDTRNAAAQFNLLATERGTQQIAAALVPVGHR